MHRWTTRFFALMTFGPILFWIGCVAVTTILAEIHGCRIDEAGAYPCAVLGRDLGETAALLGVLAAWGPFFFGPLVLVSGAAWGLYALIRSLRRQVRQ